MPKRFDPALPNRVEPTIEDDVPTILIVDDEEALRAFLLLRFQQGGYRVLEAWNGQQALHLIASGSTRPDLVLSDVMMPLIGGQELCRTLKADPTTADIPVILMSAVRPDLTAKPDGFVDKPLDLDALESIVRQLLEPRSRTSP
jgi:CheY-like chemotaxis protein